MAAIPHLKNELPTLYCGPECRANEVASASIPNINGHFICVVEVVAGPIWREHGFDKPRRLTLTAPKMDGDPRKMAG
jgi:hypothetical protein